MPELSEEMRTFTDQRDLRETIMELRQLRDELSQYGDTLKRCTNFGESEERDEMQKKLDMIAEDDWKVKTKLVELNREYHSAFNPVWGQMFVAGYQDSRFGYFVKNYACLYTSKACNLGLPLPSRVFRTSGELLPHDNTLSDQSTDFIDEE